MTGKGGMPQGHTGFTVIYSKWSQMNRIHNTYTILELCTSLIVMPVYSVMAQLIQKTLMCFLHAALPL